MPTFTHAVVLDFEATCDDERPPQPQEIIEFPSVLVDVRQRKVVDAFSSFVRPTHHPMLTPFCTELTSIQQADVDGADPFTDVFERHQGWLREHGLTSSNAIACTCGDWDLQKMLPRQLRALDDSDTKAPQLYRQWCNLKRLYTQVTGDKAKGMVGMLRRFQLPLEGHHHRGIDDCRNLARLLLTLLDKGAVLDVTASVKAGR